MQLFTCPVKNLGILRLCMLYIVIYLPFEGGCIYTYCVCIHFYLPVFWGGVFIHVVYVFIVIYLCIHVYSLFTCLLRGVYLYMLAKVSQSPTSCSCRNLSDLTVNTVPSALNDSIYMKRLIIGKLNRVLVIFSLGTMTLWSETWFCLE